MLPGQALLEYGGSGQVLLEQGSAGQALLEYGGSGQVLLEQGSAGQGTSRQALGQASQSGLPGTARCGRGSRGTEGG